MYDQLCNEINRHITTVWQSVSFLTGTFAIFALTEKNIINIDIAITLIILMVTWFVAQIIDSNYWYNRNLAIITNIERQFLEESDLKHIHYYFGQHRSSLSILTNYKIQLHLGVGFFTVFLIYHFIYRILPGFTQPIENFEIVRIFPYITFVICFYYLSKLKKYRNKGYKEFITNSPGLTVDASLVEYGGAGHPIEPSKQ